MAKNYILAEYRNETRKIEGDWSKKKFNELVSAVKSRFGIEQQVDFKIFDKGANTYFTIDRSEMREIRKGALVKVVNAKRGAKATKGDTNTGGRGRRGTVDTRSGDVRGNNNRDNGRKGNRKGGGRGGNLPPGVPAYSKADDNRRNNWNVGSPVELFSDRASKWVKGKIIDVFHDHEGEWLLVEYQGFRQKEIQRFSNYVRFPLGRGDSRDNGRDGGNGRAERKKKEDPMKRKRREKGDETQGRDGGRKDRGDRADRGGRKEEKRARKEGKKVTTQSKFRKRREDEAERETAENEIQLKGNSNNLKQYIDRAAILLRGPLPKSEEDIAEEEEARVAAEVVNGNYAHPNNTQQKQQRPQQTHNLIPPAPMEQPIQSTVSNGATNHTVTHSVHSNSTMASVFHECNESPPRNSAHFYDVFNVVRLIIEQTLCDYGLPSDVSRCISSFCCDEIRCSVLDKSELSAWPSLTMENDNAIVGFMCADSDGVGTETFAVSISMMQRNGEYSEWLSVGSITNAKRLFGAQSFGWPFMMRIENDHDEEKMFTLNGTPRAVFGRKSERFQSVNAHTVRVIEDGRGTVLCEDGKAIDGALCDCFRIRFRTNVINGEDGAFAVGFVHSEADAMILNKRLGCGTNREQSVGIFVYNNTFCLCDKENKNGKELPSQLSSDIAFPVSAQEWLIKFDFVAHSLCLFLRMPNQWALATKVDMQFGEIVPAFSLWDNNDEIEIL